MKKTLPLLSLMIALCACDKEPEYILNQDVFCGYRTELACNDRDVFCEDTVQVYVCEDVNGKAITGHVIRLHPNRIKSEDFFVKNGMVNGVAKFFLSDGGLLYERNFKDGKLHGVVKQYHKNGKLAAVTHFKHGEKVGISAKYHENGNLAVKEQYKNDTEITQNFDEQGRLQSETKIVVKTQDKNIEVQKEYDENGMIKTIYYKYVNVGDNDYVAKLVGLEEYKN